MNIACIIPARGGSKGIPGKNIKNFAGKPLIQWSIEHALNSELINKGVYVSSDSDDILNASEKAGAKAIKRPDALATDSASSEVALIHAAQTIMAQESIDLLVFLQCTSPIRKPQDIDNAIRTLLEEDADSLMSVLEIHDYFMWKKSDDHEEGAQAINYDYKNRKRRQDIPARYLENGSIYVFKPQILTENNNRLGGKIAMYPMAKFSSLQIDDADEFTLCEAVLRGLPKSAGGLGCFE